MRNLVHLALIASCVAAIGCSSSKTAQPRSAPPPFQQPSVALTDVRLNGVGLLGGSLDLELHVYNPNDYDLHQPRVSYRVMVDDVDLGAGVYDSDITIQAQDSATVRLPMSFSYASAGRAGRALLNMGAVSYRVLGYITVGTPHGRFRFPYDRVGRFATLSAQFPR